MRNTQIPKMKKYFIIISLIFLSGCKQENNSKQKALEENNVEKYSEIVENKLVYEVINSVLSEKRMPCDAVLDRKIAVFINYDSTFISKFDTLFTESDKKFLLKQYRNGNRFILNQKFVKYKKVIEFEIAKLNSKERKIKFWKKIEKEHNCLEFIYVPLFNIKKDLAIVEHGFLGERGIFIYKLEDNRKWKLYRTIERVVE